MRTRWLLILPALAACNEPQTPEPQLPKALQEPTLVDDMKVYSGRGSSRDLVEALFDDVLKSDTALQHLINDVAEQYSNHGDSTRRWVDFEQKSSRYYADGSRHAERMVDSIMRASQKESLRASEARYVASVLSARRLDSTYGATQLRVNDLEELLMIQRTLALMERYQKEQRPSDQLLRDELKRLEALEARLRASLLE